MHSAGLIPLVPRRDHRTKLLRVRAGNLKQRLSLRDQGSPDTSAVEGDVCHELGGTPDQLPD